MSEFIQGLIIVCVFLAYIFTVVLKPNRFEINSKLEKKDNGDSVKEISVTLENGKEN